MSECGKITIDLGYSGHVTLVIEWTDDNNLSYHEEIVIAARGEKPKMLRIERPRTLAALYQRIGAPGEEIRK